VIPTTSNNNLNYFAALDDDSDADTIDDTDTNANTQQANNIAINELRLHGDNSALSDSGASSHFIVDGANVINKQIDSNPITITLPDGATLQSTHTCNVNIPWLRDAATRARIVPGLAHSSLLSTASFCDAGYTVTFDAQVCQIFDGEELVLEGGRDATTNLWRLPLSPHAPPAPPAPTPVAYNGTHSTPTMRNTVNNVHTIPHLQNRVKYMHQVFFLPTAANLATCRKSRIP
jgi:hypothetical protein